jgi:uncharacterized protein YjiS (DUF1127 family)
VTDLCTPSSGKDGRERERDAPAIANMPSIRRWLRTLSALRSALYARRIARKQRRIIRLHRMNDHLLQDIGLTRLEFEESEIDRLLNPLMLPDEEDS